MTHPDTPEGNEFEQQLDDLLDSYFKARRIEVDDQRTIAKGVLDMATAHEAILKAHTAALEQARKEAAIEELQKMLDEWDWTATASQFGSASGGIVLEGVKTAFKKRLATLKGERK